jgi:UDPglucose 6-dehydrogenase
MKASVVGLGKLGSPLLAVLAASGIEVWGIDVIPETVAKIKAGLAPVPEPQLQDLITAHNARIHSTSDWRTAIAETDVTFVLVPTPSAADGAFSNRYLLSAVEEVGRVLRNKLLYHLVVINSTTMPGSVGGPIRDRLEAVSGKRVGREIGLCYNPEFIALGNVIAGLMHPDFVLIGESDARAGDLLEAFCRRVVGVAVPVARMNFVNAELTKIAINTYITTKISFANMLGEICDCLPGADADIVTSALGQDTRIGKKYLRGATGYGGPCFPRDTMAFATMARRVGVDAAIATAAQAINERQLRRVIGIVTRLTAPGERVAVLGLAYKPDTPVVEQSQGLMLAAALDKAGRRVIAHDPLAIDAACAALGPTVSFAASPEAAVAGADAVVVMTPCAEYTRFFRSWAGDEPTRLVVDCWRLVDPALVSDRLAVIQLGRNDTFGVVDDAAIAAAGN